MATDVKRPHGRQEVLDAVLDAAERLFAAKGAASVSLRTIAEEAGVTYSLVNRHFGTKDALVDQVLARFERRWLQRMARDPDYDRALETLLGSSRETGSYLRLLAWTLLTDREPAIADAHRRHVTLDRLPAMRGATPDAGATLDTAAALALAFGWRFFNQTIVEALNLEDVPDPELLRHMRQRLRHVAHFTERR